MAKILCLLLVASVSTLVKGYGSGAPNSKQICESMIPGHGDPPQTTQSPYKLTLNKNEVKPGQQVKLTIDGGNTTFKGFLVQGRKIGSVEPIGKFVAVANTGESQPLTCSNIMSSAITHTNNGEKKKITVVWVAPDAKGSYQLLTTVVKDGATYWVAQPSETITVL